MFFRWESQNLFRVEFKFYPTANCRRMGFSRLSKIIPVRDSFFHSWTVPKYFRFCRVGKTYRPNIIVVFNFISSEKFLRLTLLTNTGCAGRLQNLYCILQIILSCTKFTNSVLDCSTLKSCLGFDFHTHNQKLYFKLDYKVGIFNYGL